jgi:spore maturation protein SpmA
MFLIAAIVAGSKLVFWQDTYIFKELVDALFSATKTGFEISLYLTGVLCFWLGIMKIGENGGAVRYLTRAVSPLFSKLFPEVPKNHPAIGAMINAIEDALTPFDAYVAQYPVTPEYVLDLVDTAKIAAE